MEEKLEQTYLYDFYGELLNEHQRQIYEDFVFNDLSLGEIASEEGISRQGVADMIKRCNNKLEAYEKKLHLVKKFVSKLDEMYEMVKAVVEKSKKPVTAKVRLGWKNVDIEKICVLLEKAGVSFIAIHARTKEELYSGKPHFEELKNIRDLIHIPFGVSGNIFSVNDALNALKITRADAVLIARGGIGNPNLIKNINLALENKEYDENVTFEEQKQYLYRFMEYLKEEKGEFTAEKDYLGNDDFFSSNYRV